MDKQLIYSTPLIYTYLVGRVQQYRVPIKKTTNKLNMASLDIQILFYSGIVMLAVNCNVPFLREYVNHRRNNPR